MPREIPARGSLQPDVVIRPYCPFPGPIFLVLLVMTNRLLFSPVADIVYQHFCSGVVDCILTFLVSPGIQEGYHEFANEHFPSFDNYGVQFAPQQPIFPGPPTPPGQQMSLGAAHPGQQQPQQQQQQQQHVPVTSVPAAVVPLAPTSAMVIDQDIMPTTKPDPGMTDDTQQQQQDQSRRGGSNSDDDEMTPAQSRRKAQNRAAYVYCLFLRRRAVGYRCRC